MKLIRRNKGSQRNKAAIDVKFMINFTGQGGSDDLMFESDREYFIVQFETPEEIKELLSQAHIVHYNYWDQRS